MLHIFAKLNTDEKAAIYCMPGQVRRLMNELSQKFGGEWLLVDEVFTSGEILKFNDGMIYKGFESDKDGRYSTAIQRFRINPVNGRF